MESKKISGISQEVTSIIYTESFPIDIKINKTNCIFKCIAKQGWLIIPLIAAFLRTWLLAFHA